MFNIYIYSTMKTKNTEVLGRELNQARSKPDTVDRPVRTARTFVYHYNSTQYCSTETMFFQYSPSSRPIGRVDVRGKMMEHASSQVSAATLSVTQPLDPWEQTGHYNIIIIRVTTLHTKSNSLTFTWLFQWAGNISSIWSFNSSQFFHINYN